jgi:hypothetical protein
MRLTIEPDGENVCLVYSVRRVIFQTFMELLRGVFCVEMTSGRFWVCRIPPVMQLTVPHFTIYLTSHAYPRIFILKTQEKRPL